MSTSMKKSQKKCVNEFDQWKEEFDQRHEHWGRQQMFWVAIVLIGAFSAGVALTTLLIGVVK